MIFIKLIPKLGLLPLLIAGSSLSAHIDGYDWDLVDDGRLVVTSDEDTRSTLDLCFPSIVEIPSWVSVANRADPDAKYYMYYGEHHGRHIFMKWAENIEGPWTAYDNTGSDGVMDFTADSSRNGNGGAYAEDWGNAGSHTAAPDIHIDNDNKVFVMAFHGKVDRNNFSTDNDGQTNYRHTNFVAFSPYGLNFNDPDTGGGKSGNWGPTGNKRPYGPLEARTTKNGNRVDVTQNIKHAYMRLLVHNGEHYGFSTGGALSRPKNASDPWANDPSDPFDWIWEGQSTPDALYNSDSLADDRDYESHIATWFASSRFKNHPNNPVPGQVIPAEGISNSKAKVNHIEIFKTPGTDLLEVYVYVRVDTKPDYDVNDPFRDLMRLVLDISDPDWNMWEVAKHPVTGEDLFDVVATPSDIKAAVEAARGGDVNGRTYADPVSLGVPGIIEAEGAKYAFIGFSSSDVNPTSEHAEGQIVLVKLTEATGGGGGGTAPDSPSGLSLSVISSSEISMTWNDQSTNEDEFRLQRRVSGGTFATIATLPANQDWYNDSGLSASTSYDYRVRAQNAYGNSSNSAMKTATTLSGGGGFSQTDDFNSGYGNWNDGGSDCNRVASGPVNGSGSIRLRDNSGGTTSTVYTNSLDLSGYSSVTVEFSYRVEGFEGTEDFMLQVSTNGGGTFSTVKEWNHGTQFENDEIKSESVVVDTLSSSTVLRFRCSASDDSDLVYLDDITISTP